MGLGLFLLAILIVLASLSGRNAEHPTTSTSNDIALFCRREPAQVTKIIDSWTRLGVLKSYSDTGMDVDDKPWEGITYRAKVSIAVAGYCRAIEGSSSDTATVIIRGYRSGNQLASIVDGNFSH